MRPTLWLLLAILLGPLAGAAQEAEIAQETSRDSLAEAVRQRIESGAWHPDLADLYDERGHALAWTRPGDLRRLDARLDDALLDGLAPHETRTRQRRRLRARPDPVLRDLVTTDALLALADALAGRRVDPESLHRGHWFLSREARARRRTDAAALVREALTTDDPAASLLAALDLLQPRHPEYHALRDRLRQITAPNFALAPASLRRLPDGPAARPEAPSALPDLREVAAIRLNLERWRWLPAEFEDAHVLVNVPAARLAVRERSGDGLRTVLEMDATVGQPEPDWQTPVLSDPIRSVSFFPTWTPTVTIQRREIIPQAREDGGQRLYEKGFDVYRGTQKLDPREVDWRRARAGQYRIVQRGGPQGALGRVKFVMPNKHWILVHDTNTPEEFDGDERALSHGCVRAEDPGALADAILTRTNRWRDGRASAMIEGTPRTRGVRLRERFPVHLVYFTAWPGADGRTQILDDVYDRDRPLARALGIALPDSSALQTASR